MKKAVAYLRVSKKEEDIENQRIAISQFSKQNGYKIVEEFKDEDVSGWKVQVLKRDGFNELMRYVEKHNIKTILFFDVTRFGRSWKDTLSTYFSLSDQGYDLIFTLQPFLRLSFFYEMFKDLEEPLRTYMAETSFYKMFLEFAMRAEFESVMTSVRTKKGLEKARAKGKRIGRAPLPEQIRRRIIELYEKGKTYKEIQDIIRKEGIYKDSKGKIRAPSLGIISNVIADYERSKRNKGKLAR
ncbi:MAG: recombinase family protein [Thermoplasmata archaeon]|nr:recombinase family protein [Thermoplasmata archaeon]